MRYLLALLLLPLTVFAEVKIDVKNRVPNKEPGYCTWCSIETLGRHHNIKALFDLVENRSDNNLGTDKAIYRQLKKLKVKFKMQYFGGKKTSLIEYAIKNDLGCAVGFKPYAFGSSVERRSAHMVTMIDFNKKQIKFIDPCDCKNIYTKSRQWFDKYFDGAVIVIERN